ncbi:MAG: ferrochelatase [Candidatus Tokpelaia sp.]|nr:MAG: ferrochelatase [Candidatus Tokpelaia sp.]KAA6207367.1 MAG: ferrochelatase [Candidatus Tokpelaia sp.]
MTNNNKSRRIGVILANLGTPDGTDYWNMRRYLAEFLSDKRVIEWPSIIWQPILRLIVLSTRPKKSGAAYARIWNREKNEAPLRSYTRSQAEKLAALLHEGKAAAKAQTANVELDIDWAMRYGKPAIGAVAKAMVARGCGHILLVPLYPQYAASTTATVNDVFFDSLKAMRCQPAVRTAPAYADNAVYIDALANSITAHLAGLSYRPEKLIASYHGIPQSYVRRGDPYYEECRRTTAALRQRLGLENEALLMCFQSRFGPEEWLQPYTDKTIEKLAKEGVTSLAVFNPGFVADCLETLDEIGNEAAEIFHKNGGTDFTHIPCLNDSDEGMRVIEHIVRQELQGWL